MPIDPRIAMGVQPLQLPMQNPNNQMNMLAQALQLKNGMSQMREHERERGERDTLNEAYAGALSPDGSLDRNALTRTLAGRKLGSRIPALQEQWAKVDKAKHEAFKAAGENYKAFQLELGSEFNNPSLSKQTVAQRIAMRVQAGAMDGALGERMVAMLPDDPQQLRGALRQLVTSQMTPEQMLTVFAPKPTQVDNGQQISYRDTNPNSPTYGQVTAGAPVQKQMTPGEVASNSRGWAQLNETKRHNSVAERNQSLTLEQGKTPPGYRMKPDGSLEAIPGGPADEKNKNKPLTEGQAKANIFGTRMQESNRILNELEDGGVTNSGIIKNTVQGVAGLTPFMGDKMSEAAGSVMNTVPGILGGPNSDQQRVEQARRDFINAALRKESGAVISKEEFINADRQYFPQPGDSPAVIKQKRELRDRATGLMLSEVPGGKPRLPTQEQPAAPTAPALPSGWSVKVK